MKEHMIKKLKDGWTVEKIDKDTIFMCGTDAGSIYVVSRKKAWVAFCNTYQNALKIVKALR